MISVVITEVLPVCDFDHYVDHDWVDCDFEGFAGHD